MTETWIVYLCVYQQPAEGDEPVGIARHISLHKTQDDAIDEAKAVVAFIGERRGATKIGKQISDDVTLYTVKDTPQ